MNNPYPGLRPYEENERENFFGRDADQRILSDQILANRLTLLFAATGVGKSSLLKAAVIPHLKEPLEENLDVQYFNDWVHSPLIPFKKAVLNSLQVNGKIAPEIVAEEIKNADLRKFLEFCCLFSSQPLVLVLDQFEEFFRYKVNYSDVEFRDFIDQLTDVILDKKIPVSVVLSMREDYALELNAFKPRLPMLLFENYYRLEKLPRSAAEAAIRIPTNRIGYHWEPALFEKLLNDLLSRDFDRSKGQLVADSLQTVEPPYLQIICSQLWELDKRDPNKTIRLATYIDAEEAKGLLDNFLNEQVLANFTLQEKQLSSRAFDHLVSRRGTKMSQTAEELANTLEVKVSNLKKVLDKLSANRILRIQKREEKEWYELYHDMFSESIDDWNRDWKNRMRTRKGVIGLAIAGVIGGVCVIAWDAYINKSYQHLRMNLHDQDAYIELWQGEYGSFDFFNQQQFIMQTPHRVIDREPYLRQKNAPVNDQTNLLGEMIGSLPNNKRVSELVFDGRYKRAIELTDQSISNSEPKRSSEVIQGLGDLKTAEGSTYIWNIKTDKNITSTSINSAIAEAKTIDRFRYISHKEALVKKLYSFNSLDDINKLMLLKNPFSFKILIKALKDKDPLVRSRALKGLRMFNSAKAEKHFIKSLVDESPVVRFTAVTALEKLGTAEARKHLIKTLDDKASTVQMVSTIALARLGATFTSNQLIKLLSNDEVENGVVEILSAHLDSVKSDHLINLLKHHNASVRARAASLLSNFRELGINKHITILTNDRDPQVRLSAVSALGKLADPKNIPNLIEVLLKDTDKKVQAQAALSLGQLRATRAKKHLANILENNTSEQVRLSAVIAIGAIGGTDIIEYSSKALQDDNWEIRLEAVKAMDKLGEHLVVKHLLIKALKDKDPDVQIGAVTALTKFKDTDSIKSIIDYLLNNADAADTGFYTKLNEQDLLNELSYAKTSEHLIDALRDKNPDIRARSAELLGNFSYRETSISLIPFLLDESSNVRNNTAIALGRIGNRNAIPFLIKSLKDKKSKVRASSIKSIAKLGEGEPHIKKQLIAALEDEDPNVRVEAIYGLGKFEGNEFENIFVDALSDEHFKVRTYAIEALEKIGTENIIKPLISKLRDEKELVKLASASALTKLNNQESIYTTLRILKAQSISDQVNRSDPVEKRNKLRLETALHERLGEIESANLTRHLINSLGTPQVRFQSGITLGKKYSSSGNTPSIGNFLNTLLDWMVYPNYWDFESSSPISYNYETKSIKLISGFDKTHTPDLLKAFNHAFDNSEFKNTLSARLLNLNTSTAHAYLVDRLNNASSPQKLIQLIKMIAKNPSNEGRALMLERFDPNLPEEIIQSWITAFGEAKVRDAAPLLIALKYQANSNIIKYEAQVALVRLETSVDKIRSVILNNKLELRLRQAALDALFDLPRTLQVEELIALSKDKTLSQNFIARLHLQLDKLRVKEASSIWQSKLANIERKEIQLRKIRETIQARLDSSKNDNPPTPEKILENKPDDLKLYKTDYQINGVPYAYALARIDPVKGLDLLNHPLFDFRKGAWLGLSSVANASFIRDELSPLFWSIQNESLHRNAVFRAIDHSLTTLEFKANLEDLDTLKAWFKELDLKDNPVAQRVEWTIAQIEYSLKEQNEQKRKYNTFIEKQSGLSKVKRWPN